MNIARNMEAIFLATLVIIGATGFARAAVPVKRAHAPVVSYTVDDAGTAVVTVTAKRLTAAEKAQLAD
ncbi:MAG: hypothetical protein ACXU8N_12570 [Telluria sp.]